jgi:hypothetical protein
MLDRRMPARKLAEAMPRVSKRVRICMVCLLKRRRRGSRKEVEGAGGRGEGREA